MWCVYTYTYTCMYGKILIGKWPCTCVYVLCTCMMCTHISAGTINQFSFQIRLSLIEQANRLITGSNQVSRTGSTPTFLPRTCSPWFHGNIVDAPFTFKKVIKIIPQSNTVQYYRYTVHVQVYVCNMNVFVLYSLL